MSQLTRSKNVKLRITHFYATNVKCFQLNYIQNNNNTFALYISCAFLSTRTSEFEIKAVIQALTKLPHNAAIQNTKSRSQPKRPTYFLFSTDTNTHKPAVVITHSSRARRCTLHLFPTFTRRKSGDCLGTVTVVNVLFFLHPV